MKPWLDRRTHELSKLLRRAPRLAGFWQSYEKAGLRVTGEPIPWNADTVLVEALVEWYGKPLESKSEFELQVTGELPMTPTSITLRRENVYHLTFRMAPVASTRVATLQWRSRQLGLVELASLSRESFLWNLQAEAPTVFARLGGECVPCKSLVEGQQCDLVACSLIRSPTSLLPLLDSGLVLEAGAWAGEKGQVIPLRLTSEQLLGRQAMLTVPVPHWHADGGHRSIAWTVGGRVLARRELRLISEEAFLLSLYVPSGWYWPSGDHPLAPALHTNGIGRSTGDQPLYLHIASREAGIAATCSIEVHLRYRFRGGVIEMEPQNVVVTDAPSPCLAVSSQIEDLRDLKGIEVYSRGRYVGNVTWEAAPTAVFTAEGGFRAYGGRSWTPFDELKLEERLNRLCLPKVTAGY
jgi:hypothetical protein